MRLDELARQLSASCELTLTGDGSVFITDVAPLETAQPGQISFLLNARYARQLETTQASAVIVAPNFNSSRVAMLKTKDPYFAWARTITILRGFRKHLFEGIHPKAHVDPSASVGEGTVVYPGAFIGPRVKVGNDCIIYPNVTIYDDSVIGDRVILHANTTIGVDGYGFAQHNGVHHKVPQTGNVVIEDDVEVGANCTIARAALASTIIGAGTKIDSQVMIGHNVKTGKGCLIVAQVGLAGSVELGDYVTLAGQVGIAGHLKIGDKASIAAKSGVMTDIEPGSIMMGMPAMPQSDARRVYAAFLKLPELVQRLRELEQQVQDLTDSGDTPIA
jgi:UDP-3-O-[3-hydroxymyristoyl] glucosamine N-acyltransferase